jgi:hypothetical protein
VLTTKDVKIVLRKPWWALIKNEVARVVAIRIKTDDASLKPHGSILGQMFVDIMNELEEVRSYVHYLTTRKWAEILSDVEGDLSAEALQVLSHGQGAMWFSEFQRFLNSSWKRSIADGAPLAIFDTFDHKTFEAISNEWFLHLKNGHPALLATVMLEWMRDPDNGALRKSAVTACAFLSVRSWPEVLRAVGEHFGKDLVPFDLPGAAEFFEKFKAMMKSEVKSYWEDQLTS